MAAMSIMIGVHLALLQYLVLIHQNTQVSVILQSTSYRFTHRKGFNLQTLNSTGNVRELAVKCLFVRWSDNLVFRYRWSTQNSLWWKSPSGFVEHRNGWRDWRREPRVMTSFMHYSTTMANMKWKARTNTPFTRDGVTWSALYRAEPKYSKFGVRGAPSSVIFS